MFKALPTTGRVEIIDKKIFAKATLDENVKIFMIHIAFLNLGSKIIIYLA